MFCYINCLFLNVYITKMIPTEILKLQKSSILGDILVVTVYSLNQKQQKTLTVLEWIKKRVATGRK